MTHAPIPFLMSNKGYGVWLESTFRTGFHLGSDAADAWRMYAAEPHLRYHVLVHPQLTDVITHYTSLTGRASLAGAVGVRPAAARGPRRHGDGPARVPGAAHVQRADDDGRRRHALPAERIGRGPGEHAVGMVPDAARARVQVASATTTRTCRRPTPAAAHILAAGRKGDFFLKIDDGTEFDTFMHLGRRRRRSRRSTSPTRPRFPGTGRCYSARSTSATTAGCSTSASTCRRRRCSTTARRAGRRTTRSPSMYDKVVFDYLQQQVRGNDFMFFARAGGAGSQAYAPVMWSGDPSASFDDVKGLPANVRAGLNAGHVGLPVLGQRHQRLHLPQRSACRQGGVPALGRVRRAVDRHARRERVLAGAGRLAPPKWTLWSDTETTQVYGQYASLHTRLLPYTYAAAQVATQTGVPIMRHPILYVSERARRDRGAVRLLLRAIALRGARGASAARPRARSGCRRASGSTGGR